jgi:hypothetical protein
MLKNIIKQIILERILYGCLYKKFVFVDISYIVVHASYCRPFHLGWNELILNGLNIKDNWNFCLLIFFVPYATRKSLPIILPYHLKNFFNFSGDSELHILKYYVRRDFYTIHSLSV